MSNRYAPLKVDMEAVRDVASQERRRYDKKQLADAMRKYASRIKRDLDYLRDEGVGGVEQISDEQVFLIGESARDHEDPENGEFAQDEIMRVVTGA